jgi:hypothetical protein
VRQYFVSARGGRCASALDKLRQIESSALARKEYSLAACRTVPRLLIARAACRLRSSYENAENATLRCGSSTTTPFGEMATK